MINPSPYMAYFDFGSWFLIGSSPEVMVKAERKKNKEIVVSCDEVVWSIFGLSAASINTIVLLFIFVINALYLLNKYEKKEKK